MESKVKSLTNSFLDRKSAACLNLRASAMKIKLLKKWVSLKKQPRRGLMTFKKELDR